VSQKYAPFGYPWKSGSPAGRATIGAAPSHQGNTSARSRAYGIQMSLPGSSSASTRLLRGIRRSSGSMTNAESATPSPSDAAAQAMRARRKRPSAYADAATSA